MASFVLVDIGSDGKSGSTQPFCNSQGDLSMDTSGMISVAEPQKQGTNSHNAIELVN
jgi:hypothetical protein